MVKPCSRNKNSPLVRLQNKYERYGTENNVLSGRGLARRPLSARRVHIKMTSHVAQCIHNTSYCAARELCRLQIWTKRYREHFTVLVIWTLVYREHVPRTFCQGFVPRTYMNGLSFSTIDFCVRINHQPELNWPGTQGATICVVFLFLIINICNEEPIFILPLCYRLYIEPHKNIVIGFIIKVMDLLACYD